MSRPSVVVTVGTDHHPFDRLVTWTDRWTTRHPDVTVFVQHGTAIPPEVAIGAALVDPADLAARVAGATAVVTHGGLSSIMETRAAGFLPLVVARDPAAGEHVDGHQQAFSANQARLGRIVRLDDEEAFVAALDGAIADPSSIRLDPTSVDVSAAVAEVAGLVDDLLRTRPPRQRRKALR
jgi:UDP-N-acetylglucosamine transferase subunit ALG13